MTKPTGRPRGRPKTKEYVTLMARFPQDLAEQIERYAGRKQQTISEVLRDGALVLLQEDEDAYRPFMSDRKAAGDILSDTKEEEEPPKAPPLIMSDINAALAPAAGTAEKSAAIVSDAITAFDAAKFVLGKLCPRGHDYHGAGQSLLRRSDRHCIACEREKPRKRQRAKRA